MNLLPAAIGRAFKPLSYHAELLIAPPRGDAKIFYDTGRLLVSTLPTYRSLPEGIVPETNVASVKSQLNGIIRHRVIPDGRFCDIMATSTPLCGPLLPPYLPEIDEILIPSPDRTWSRSSQLRPPNGR